MTQDDAGGARRIRGRYAFVPNPCTTRPCLPGMAGAVEADGTLYFLTLRGQWCGQELAWDGYRPEPGDRVAATGRIEQRVDVEGRPFLCVAATSLVPAPD